MKGLAFIMPCFNAGAHVFEAAESIRQQDFGTLPYELVIVDDGSDDKETANELSYIEGLNDPHIHIYRLPENQGQSAARNYALRLAQYDFVFPLDADDILNPKPQIKTGLRFIGRGVNILERDPDVAFVYAITKMFGAKTNIPRPDPYSEKRHIARGMVPVGGIYRRKEALAFGGYDTKAKCVEDWIFWNDMLGQRAREGRERKVIRLIEPFYLYRQHEHNHSVNKRERDYPALYQRFFEKIQSCSVRIFLELPMTRWWIFWYANARLYILMRWVWVNHFVLNSARRFCTRNGWSKGSVMRPKNILVMSRI